MNQKTNRFTPIKSNVTEYSDMSKDDRRRVVLAFMAKHQLVLKPASVYRNLRFHQNITFGSATVRNILHELVDKDYVQRVNINRVAENRELDTVDKGSKKGAYIITELGIKEIESDSPTLT